MNRKQQYRDKDKCRETCRRQKQRYYGRTSFLYPARLWTHEEDEMVTAHEITDSELSAKIERSVRAIQRRRWQLKHQAEGVQEKSVNYGKNHFERGCEIPFFISCKSKIMGMETCEIDLESGKALVYMPISSEVRFSFPSITRFYKSKED